MAPKNSSASETFTEQEGQGNGENSALSEIKKPAPIDPYRAAGVDKQGEEEIVISDPVIFLSKKYMPGDRLLVATDDARMLEEDGVIED